MTKPEIKETSTEHVSGISEFESGNIQVYFRENELVFAQQKFGPKKTFSILYYSIKEILFYIISGTTVIKLENNEIILNKNSHKLYLALKPKNQIKIKVDGKRNDYPFPKGLKIFAIFMVALSLLLLIVSVILFIGKGLIVGGYLILISLLNLCLYIGLFLVKSWALKWIQILIYLSLFLSLFDLNTPNFILRYTVQVLISIVILVYLNSENVKNYFNYKKFYDAIRENPSCLVPFSYGLQYNKIKEVDLWEVYYTLTPRQRQRSEQKYKTLNRAMQY